MLPSIPFSRFRSRLYSWIVLFSTRATRVFAPAALITMMLWPAMGFLSRPMVRGERGPGHRATIATALVEPGFRDRLSNASSKRRFSSHPRPRFVAARRGAFVHSGVEVARRARLSRCGGPSGPREAHAFLQDLHSPGRRPVTEDRRQHLGWLCAPRRVRPQAERDGTRPLDGQMRHDFFQVYLSSRPLCDLLDRKS